MFGSYGQGNDFCNSLYCCILRYSCPLISDGCSLNQTPMGTQIYGFCSTLYKISVSAFNLCTSSRALYYIISG